MKKKKILVGSLLGITILAAGASLASCDLSLAPTYEATRATATTPTKTPVTPTGTSTVKPTQTTPTGTTVTPTPTTSTVTPVQTYKVTYNTLGHGTAPDAVEGITKLPTTLPVVADDGLYKFLGWSAEEGGTTLVTAGSALTADTTLYAVWEKTSLYDAIANSNSAIYATKFDGDETVSEYLEYKVGYKGVYSLSEQTEKLKVEIKDGKLVLTDTDGADPAVARIHMGFAYSGFVEGTVKINFKDSGGSNPSKQSLFTLYGFTGFDKEATIFALRSNTNRKLQILPGAEDGNSATSYVGTELDWTQGTEFELYWNYDFDTNKLNVSVDEKDLLVDYALPEKYVPVLLTSVEFRTAGSSTSRSSELDEFAVANQDAMNIEESKAYFLSLVDKEFSKFDLTKYTFNKDAMTTLVEFIKTDINDSNTVEDFVELTYYLNFLYSFDDDETYAAKLAQYKTNNIEALNETKGNLVDSFKINATAFEKLFTDTIASINAAESKSAIDEIMEKLDEDLEKIKSDSEIKTEYVEELTDYANSLKKNINDSNLSNEDKSDACYSIDEKLSSLEQEIYDCDPLNLDNKYEFAKGTLDAIIEAYSKSLQENIEAAEAGFAIIKNSALNTELMEVPATIYQEYATATSNLRQNIEDVTLDFTEANTILKVRLEAQQKAALISGYVTEHNRIILVFNAQEDLKTVYNTLLDTLENADAKAAFTTSYTSLDALLKESKIDEITENYTEYEKVLKNDDFYAAFQIELDAREDVEVNVLAGKENKFDAFTSITEASTITSDKQYSVFTISKGSYTQFKEQYDSSNKYGYFSLYCGNNVKFTVKEDGAAFMVSYSSNNSSRKIILSSTNSGYTQTAKYASGDYLVQSKEDNQYKFTFDNKDYLLDVSLKGWLIFDNLPAGDYVVTFDTDESGNTGVAGKAETKLERLVLFDKEEKTAPAKLNAITNVEFNTEYAEGADLSTLIKKVEAEAYYDSNGDGVINTADDKKTIELDTTKLNIEVKDGNDTVVAKKSLSDSTANVNNLTATGEYNVSISYSSTGTTSATTKYNSKEISSAQITVDQTTRYDVTFNTNGGSAITAQSVKDGEKATRPETDPTQENCSFAGWYSDAALTTEFDFNTAITEATTIYAKWYDNYRVLTNSNDVFDATTSFTAAANIKEDNKKYGIFSISKGEHSQFKEQYDSSKGGYFSLYCGNNVKFTVKNDGAAFMISYFSNNSSRKVILSSNDSGYTGATKYANGDYLVSSTADSQYIYTFNNVEYTLEASEKGWIIFDNLPAGNYVLTFDTDESGKTGGLGNAETKLERFRLLDQTENYTPISSISAEVTGGTDSISVANAKVTTVEDTPKTIAASGYKVYLDGSTEEATVTNGVIENVSAGDHKVTIKYGKFTVATYENITVTTNAITEDTTYELASEDFFTQLNVTDNKVQGFSKEFGKITIDATNGKFAKNNTSWSQFNGGAIITFRVLANTKVTVNGYSAKGISINDVYSEQTTFSRYFATGTVVVIKALDPNGYINSITVDVNADPVTESTEISSIAITGQTTAFDNEATFELGTNAKLEVVYSDGLIRNAEVSLDNVTFEDGVLANGKFAVSNQVVTATVTYEGKTTTYEINVGKAGIIDSATIEKISTTLTAEKSINSGGEIYKGTAFEITNGNGSANVVQTTGDFDESGSGYSYAIKENSNSIGFSIKINQASTVRIYFVYFDSNTFNTSKIKAQTLTLNETAKTTNTTDKVNCLEVKIDEAGTYAVTSSGARLIIYDVEVEY